MQYLCNKWQEYYWNLPLSRLTSWNVHSMRFDDKEQKICNSLINVITRQCKALMIRPTNYSPHWCIQNIEILLCISTCIKRQLSVNQLAWIIEWQSDLHNLTTMKSSQYEGIRTIRVSVQIPLILPYFNVLVLSRYTSHMIIMWLPEHSPLFQSMIDLEPWPG